MTPDDFRRIALSLPEAIESSHMDHPDFRVAGKIFASLPDVEQGVVKLQPEQQEIMVETEPGIFSRVDGYWGQRGWTFMRLTDADEATLRGALTASWRNVAPAKMQGLLA